MLRRAAMAVRSAAVRAAHAALRTLADVRFTPAQTHAADAVPSAPSRDRCGVCHA